MKTKNLIIFTRTPLHVGAGSSVGAIDQPIQRERHTGFPIIPGSSIKGSLADGWNHLLETDKNGKKVRANTDASWLFGSDNPDQARAGALQFSEAKLLAFPVHSAKGGFAWVTCPLILNRAKRDGLINFDTASPINPSVDQSLLEENGALTIDGNVILDEYTFTRAGNPPEGLGQAVSKLLPDDEIWQQVAFRLVILSDGMMSYFAKNACEVAQHVRIDDETGTAADRALFNQENVPSETLFYVVTRATEERTTSGTKRSAAEALEALETHLRESHNLQQFGGDASTGLGYCTTQFSPEDTSNNP